MDTSNRSYSMSNASLIMGILAIVTPYLVFTPLLFGSSAIATGLLSRGSDSTVNTRAKTGIVLGIIALIILLLLMIGAITMLSDTYGGMDAFMEYYENTMNEYTGTTL